MRFRDEAMRAPDGSRLKVPHMGWNRVRQTQTHPLWDGIDDDSWFYFVHSYHVVPTDERLKCRDFRLRRSLYLRSGAG